MKAPQWEILPARISDALCQRLKMDALATGKTAIVKVTQPLVTPQEYVFVTGAKDNAIAVFQRNTAPGSPNFGKLVFLQRLVNNAGGVTGLGSPNSLAADAYGRLFDGFSSSKAGGNGIGLSLCKNIVTRHGGEIAAKPAPHGGLECSFSLPLATATPTAIAPAR